MFFMNNEVEKFIGKRLTKERRHGAKFRAF